MRDRHLILSLSLLLLVVTSATACDAGGGETASEPDAGGVVDVAGAPDVGSYEDVAGSLEVAESSGLHPAVDATTYYQVGVAERSMAPEDPVPMGGFGLGGGGADSVRWSEGVHDAPMVTAFCVMEAATGEFVVFLGMDIIGLMLPDTQEIRARFAAKVAEDYGVEVPAERVVLSASHAHSTADSIGVWGAFPEQLRDAAYIEIVVEAAAEAAAEAYGTLADAEITLGRGWLDNSIEGDVMGMDGSMLVLSAESPAGETIGSLTVWSAHPTCYGSGNNALSADFVGTFRAMMKEASGGGVHTYLQGPIGNVYAQRSAEAAPPVDNPFTDGYMDPDVSEDSHRMVAGVGNVVAETAMGTLAEGTALAEAPLRTKRLLYSATVGNTIYQMLAAMNVVPREMVDCDGGKCTEAEAMWLSLGGLDWATMAGEAFPHYADAIRDKLVAFGATEGETVVIGLGNDWLGYLLIPEEYSLEEFEYHRSLSPGYTWLEQHLAALDELLGGE